MSTKETRLPTTQSIEHPDKIRIIQDDSSRSITWSNLLKSFLDSGAVSEQLSFIKIDNNYTLTTASERVILVDTQQGEVTITLGSAGGFVTELPESGDTVSQVFTIKNTNPVNKVTIVTSGGEFIDNDTSVELGIDNQLPSVQIISDGVGWWIVGA